MVDFWQLDGCERHKRPEVGHKTVGLGTGSRSGDVCFNKCGKSNHDCWFKSDFWSSANPELADSGTGWNQHALKYRGSDWLSVSRSPDYPGSFYKRRIIISRSTA